MLTLSPKDYYSFEYGGYIIQCQVVVDVKRYFLDVLVSMLGSTHDM